MKVLIAMFKTEYADQSAILCGPDGTCWADKNDGYVRLTDTIEVDFTEIPIDVRRSVQLSKLERQEEKAREEFNKMLNCITKERTALMGDVEP